MPCFRGREKLLFSAFAQRQKKEQDCYLKNGSSVLEEFLALCNGNCRIPIRYFTANEIQRTIKHSKSKMELSQMSMVTGSLEKRPVLVRFSRCRFANIHRDIAITAQMSHLKNVLRLVGCCLEFEKPVMVYEYVEAITLTDLLLREGDHKTRKSSSWGKRLRIANEVASALVFLHTEFSTPILYRNIKPHKVIIDQNSGVAKIIDFSSSISLPPGETEVQDAVIYGTFWYLDPEYASLGIVTQKTDVYSFGFLLFQLLTGKESLDCMQSKIEEGNVIDRVDSSIEEPTDFEGPNAPTMFFLMQESNVTDIADPTFFGNSTVLRFDNNWKTTWIL